MIRRHPSLPILILAAPLWASTPTAASAQPPDRAALVTQAQTGYLSGDAAAVARVAGLAKPWAKSMDAKDLYAYAFIEFRALQLAIGTRREKDAERAGEACIAATDAAVKIEPDLADAFALQSACYGYLANLGGMGAIRNGSRSGKSMEAALALAPRSPRVQLVEGFGLYFRPKFVGGDKVKGCARFRAAAAAFDATGVHAGTGGIDWGAAESHLWSGRCARDAGDAAAATKSFERALQLAPNFAAAKRALGR
jgi:hypothetical protein